MKDITRYDRNLARNVTDFSLYEKDSTLIKNLVTFFSHDINHGILTEDLFGKKILDPAVFAQQMGYKNYRSLIKKHSDPAQFRGKSPKEVESLKKEFKELKEPIWETELCNAIFRMRYESLRFSKPGTTPDGLQTSELKEIRFLKGAKKFYDPKTKKIFYELEYDETFQNNLARYFMKIYKSAYAELRKPGLQDLYIYLVNMRDLAKHQYSKLDKSPEKNNEYVLDSVSFDHLCMLAGTNCERPAENKRYLIKAFNKINKAVGAESFILTWSKQGRFLYKPIITFKFTDVEIVDLSNEHGSRFKGFFHKKLKEIFRKEFLKTNVIEQNQEKFNTQFIDWLKDNESGKIIPLKWDAYASTHILCFGREVDIYKEKTKESCAMICNELAKEETENSYINKSAD